MDEGGTPPLIIPPAGNGRSVMDREGPCVVCRKGLGCVAGPSGEKQLSVRAIQSVHTLQPSSAIRRLIDAGRSAIEALAQQAQTQNTRSKMSWAPPPIGSSFSARRALLSRPWTLPTVRS